MQHDTTQPSNVRLHDHAAAWAVVIGMFVLLAIA
jgi:hypothetical protein